MSAARSRTAIDFGAVAALALANARHLLPRWFPLGRSRGRNFCIGDLDGGRGESLCISTASGQWLDFARPSDRGGDLVALNAARLRASQAEAAHDICAQLGIDLPLKAGLDRRSAPAPRLAVVRQPPPELAPDEAQERAIALALRIWGERRPLQDSPAATYLRTRGLPLEGGAPEDLAFHPRCPRGGGTAPAMLALLRDAETMRPCGIHRTFLLPDGSGKDATGGRKAKMMLGRAKGAVVALTPSEDVAAGLGIAEGIEDALTLLHRGWAPMWACCSAGGIGGLPALGGVEALTIFGDNDDAGLDGARECAIRWADAGREVTVHIPRQDGADWNGIHTGRAAA